MSTVDMDALVRPVTVTRPPPSHGWPAIGLVLWLVACLQPAHALDPHRPFSQYAHERWSINEGLPYPGGSEIAQDSEGYIWLGSMSGLSRFDGSRMTNYDGSTTPALNGNFILGLQPDAQGRLWMGTYHGTVVYDRGSFTRVPALQDRSMTLLGRDGDLMLISDYDAVLAVGADLQIKRRYEIPRANGFGRRGEELWFSTGGDSLYCACEGELTRHVLPLLGPGNATQIVLEGERLWVRTTAGLYYNDGSLWQRHADPRLHGRALSMLLDRDGNLWVGMERRLLRLHGGEVVEENDIGEVAPTPRHLFEDREGSLWLASSVSGLHRFWNGVADLTPLYTPEDRAHYVWALAPWEGGLIAGGSFGLAMPRDGVLLPLPETRHLPLVYSLHRDGDSLLLGTDRGVYRYHPDRHIEVPAGLEELATTNIYTFLRDRQERLWIGTSRGLYRLDDNARLQRITGQDNSNRWGVRTLLQMRDGRLFAAGSAGLWQLHDNTVVPVPLPKADLSILALHETAGGELLAGSRADATLYLQQGDDWLVLGRDRGVPANEIYAITPDNRGNLLVSGLRGAYLFAESELARLALDPSARLESRGLLTLNRRYQPGQEVVCCVGGGDGRVHHDGERFHLAATPGIFSIRMPSNVPSPSRPRIERMSTTLRADIFGRDLDHALELDAGERDLQLEFSAVNLSPLHTPRLKYRLQGYDRTWRSLPVQAQPIAQYTNLPPGDYRFDVMDEAWPASGKASLEFQVAPHLHETAAFKLALAAAILLAVMLLARAGSLRHHRRQHELEQEVARRTDELRNAYERLDSLSRTDALTGLHNRRHAAEAIPARLQRLRQETGTESGLASDVSGVLFVLLDIDHFKSINDRYGHRVGDAALREVAERLSRQTRLGDCLVRWGGEEFLLVCFNVAEGDQEAMAERLCASMRDEPIRVDGKPLHVTASVGVTLVPATSEALAADWEQMVHTADSALYEAKRAGRDGWRELPFGARPSQCLRA